MKKETKLFSGFLYGTYVPGNSNLLINSTAEIKFDLPLDFLSFKGLSLLTKTTGL